MNNIVINKITIALFDNDTNLIYKNYSRIRGVYGIVLVTSGAALYTFSDGRTKVLSEGEIALFSDQCAYIVENKDGKPLEHYTINFSALNSDINFPKETYLTPENIEPYKKLCENILFHTHTANNLKAMSALYSILADILENPLSDIHYENNFVGIYPALSYLETEYKSDITIAHLADLCMMSPTTFRRNFKKASGVSPMEYLLRVRIDRAKQLLKHSALSVCEISALCGFNDVEYFCRTFKKRVNLTAGKYRTDYENEYTS